MDIRVDLRSKVPLGEQIYAGLLIWINRSTPALNEQMPTVRELATRLQVNFNTVARVYRRLDLEGWISTQQGRGTFIVTHGERQITTQLFSEKDFLQGIEKYIQDEAAHAGLAEQKLWRLVQQRIDQNLGRPQKTKKYIPVKKSLRARPHFLQWNPIASHIGQKTSKRLRARASRKLPG